MNTSEKLIYFMFLFISINCFGQEETTEDFSHHSIAILISHTIITEAIEGDEKTTLSVPSWAISYNYSFNEKWAIGLHNDIIIENFEIEKNSGEEVIERTTPITSVIVGTYEIIKGVSVELGAGMEFDKDENFGLIRIGAEYGIAKPKLEVLFAMDYDIIFDAYNSFSIGFGIAKLF